jgi:UDP-glucose 4-epimerase
MCSANKARELLDYKTETDLKTAISKTVDYIKSAGVKEFDYSFPLEIINELTPKTWKDRLM